MKKGILKRIVSGITFFAILCISSFALFPEMNVHAQTLTTSQQEFYNKYVNKTYTFSGDVYFEAANDTELTEGQKNGTEPYVVTLLENSIIINGVTYGSDHMVVVQKSLDANEFYLYIMDDGTENELETLIQNDYKNIEDLYSQEIHEYMSQLVRLKNLSKLTLYTFKITTNSESGEEFMEFGKSALEKPDDYTVAGSVHFAFNARSVVGQQATTTVTVTDTQSASVDVRAKITGEDLVNNPKISFTVSYMDFDYIYDLTSSTWTTDSKDFSITNNSRVAENWDYDDAMINVNYATTMESLQSIIQGELSRKDETAPSQRADGFVIGTAYDYTLKISNQETDKNKANKALGKLSETEFTKIGTLTVSYDVPSKN